MAIKMIEAKDVEPPREVIASIDTRLVRAVITGKEESNIGGITVPDVVCLDPSGNKFVLNGHTPVELARPVVMVDKVR